MKKTKKNKKAAEAQKKDKLTSSVTKCATGPKAVLPGPTSFFDASPISSNKVSMGFGNSSSSSDNEESQIEISKKRKKKILPEEKSNRIKKKNEEIYRLEQENELLDINRIAKNAGEFEKLVFSYPNSSTIWAKYIAYHVSTTEIEKARNIAKRAVSAIDPVMTEEKFNIFVVWLNLENSYGNEKQFNDVFAMALTYCDSTQVYLSAIQILAESGKMAHMEELARKATKKFKGDQKFWLELAKIYYQNQQFKEARKCQESCVRNTSNKREQENVIVRFAIMEFQNGEVDRGCAVFDTILSIDPKKLYIWFIYTHQLVSKKKIEEAREIFIKASNAKLKLKQMKSLFEKWRKFEEEHGTMELLQNVKTRAVEYIEKFNDKS